MIPKYLIIYEIYIEEDYNKESSYEDFIIAYSLEEKNNHLDLINENYFYILKCIKVLDLSKCEPIESVSINDRR